MYAGMRGAKSQKISFQIFRIVSELVQKRWAELTSYANHLEVDVTKRWHKNSNSGFSEKSYLIIKIEFP